MLSVTWYEKLSISLYGLAAVPFLYLLLPSHVLSQTGTLVAEKLVVASYKLITQAKSGGVLVPVKHEIVPKASLRSVNNKN